MARPVVTVTYLNGDEQKTKIFPRVEVNAELHFKEGMGDLQKSRPTQVVYWMAYESLRLKDQLPKDESFESWLDRVEDCDVEELNPREGVDGHDDPTRKAQ